MKIGSNFQNLKSLEKAKDLKIDVDPELEDFEVTNDIFEKVIEHTLVQPTFVTHIPKRALSISKDYAG